MRIGKTLVIAGVIMGLLVGTIMGCETLKNAFCSPTAQEVADAADFVTNADALVAFLNTLAPSAEVTAVIAALKVARAVFEQIKSGICVSSDQQTAAQAAINASQVMALKLGYKP
jgi:choline-glycine betaine transporter